MVGSALIPQETVDRLAAISPEVRASLVLDGGGRVAAHAGVGDAEEMAAAARDLLAAADAASDRSSTGPAMRLEVSGPLGGVFAVRPDATDDDRSTLVAVTAPGALPALVLYDMRMALRGEGEGE